MPKRLPVSLLLLPFSLCQRIMRISGLLFDKALLFALRVYKERYYVSMEFRPQNTGCGADDHHFRLEGCISAEITKRLTLGSW